MKKVIGRITVLVLSLMLVFSMAACDDKDGESESGKNSGGTIQVTQLVNNTVSAMLDKQGFTATATASLPGWDNETSGMPLNGMTATAAYAKSGNAYDSKLQFGEMIMIQKGADTFETDDNGKTWYKTSGVTTESINAAEIKAQVSGLLGGLDLGALTKENNVYKIGGTFDFGAKISDLITFITSNAEEEIADVVAGLIGKQGYTGASLKADLTAIFAETTMGGVIEKVNVMLVNMGIPVTTEQLIDAVCEEAGMTATAIYEMMGGTQSGLVAPNVGESASAYIKRALGNTSSDVLAQIIMMIINGSESQPNPEVSSTYEAGMEQVTWADLGSKLIDSSSGLLYQHFGDVYENMAAEMANGTLYWYLNAICDPQSELGAIGSLLNTVGFLKTDVVQKWLHACDSQHSDYDLTTNGYLLGVESLKKLHSTANGNTIAVNVEINGDFTLKSISVEIKIDLKYNNEQMAKATGGVAIAFDYTVPSIQAPTGNIVSGGPSISGGMAA